VSSAPLSDSSNWALVEAETIRNEEQLDLPDCSVRVYNVDRELWKGITKARLIQYYYSVSSFMLPHIQHRPLSLHLKLKGPNAPGAYIKDMEGRQPECAEIFTTKRKHHKPGKREVIDYLVCNNVATLVYTINIGCIDVNPWTSSTHAAMNPDYIVIDLDPSDKDFSKAIETARAAKEFFDRHKLEAFPKTSGKTGMHLYLPCMAFSFPQARRIAEHICTEIHLLVPEISTTELTVSDRGTRLYIDPNQNDYADTVAAPYSVRPYKKPTVSTPLSWREVKPSLDAAMFTIQTMEKRLRDKGDLFQRVLDKKVAVANDKVLQKFI
jgi:bifunctional non-homologous end joining protein LigD